MLPSIEYNNLVVSIIHVHNSLDYVETIVKIHTKFHENNIIYRRSFVWTKREQEDERFTVMGNAIQQDFIIAALSKFIEIKEYEKGD